MTVGEIVKELERYPESMMIYDAENEEYYVSAIKYDEEGDNLLVYFE